MSNLINNDTFCSSLFNHQMIDATGRIKPCCRFNEKDRDKSSSIKLYTVHEVFSGTFMQSLREKSINNQRIAGCARCYEEQDNNKQSLRNRINSSSAFKLDSEEEIVDPKLSYLELSISNDCNLMCRMCDSRFSFKLFDEEVKYYGKPFSKDRKTRIDVSSIYEIAHNLKSIKFTGGEPLMIKEHWELLEYCVEMGYAKNISLNYSTNCTIFPKDKITSIWKNFKHIDIVLSIDSVIKEINEYQRHLTDHDDAMKNVEMYLEYSKSNPNIRVLSRPTVTVFNMMYMPETIDWIISRGMLCNPTHLTYPEWLSITIFPNEIKNAIREKYETYEYETAESKSLSSYLISYMDSMNNQGKLADFVNHTKFLDEQRNQSFVETFPYLSAMMRSNQD
jgi:organic radical activating enzyme